VPAGVRVVLVAVQSIDGYITPHDDPGAAPSASAAAQRHFRDTMRQADCAIFGGATYRADRDHIRPDLRPDLLRVAWTRRPELFAAEAVPGQLEFSASEPAAILADMAARGRRRCALLGGQEVFGRFLADDLVDELLVTIEPLMFGSGLRLNATPVDRAFELADVVRLSEQTLLLRYVRPGLTG
jgi:dihydrofolate reductase